jgi:hypothetical protein
MDSASLAFQLFNGSLAGYKFIRDISSIGRDSVLLSVKLRVEEHRLRAWGDQSGISRGILDQFLATDPLLSLFMATLGCIVDILTDAKKLNASYGLRSATNTSLSPQLDTEESQHSDSSLITSSSVTNERGRLNQLAKRVQRSLAVNRKLRWVIEDKARLESLISELTDFNDRLVNLLPFGQQTRVSQVHEMNVLSPDDSQVLRQIEQVARTKYPNMSASAALKALCVEVDVSHSDIQGTYNHDPAFELELPFRDFQLPNVQLTDDSYCPPSLAVYRGGVQPIPVLVSWKRNGRFDSLDIEEAHRIVRQRVENLAQLLHIPKPSELRVLPCRGYFWNGLQVGFVFSLPQDTTARPTSLKKLLDSSSRGTRDSQRSKERRSKPPLQDRFSLAASLANSMYHLHRSNWLHKSWSSYNVLFFLDDEGNTICEPYITGFDYTRWDSTNMVSEHPVIDPEHDLYRHPDIISFLLHRFQRKHDRYR